MDIKNFIKRHAVVSYFILAFAISWGGIFFVVGGLAGFRSDIAPDVGLIPLVFLAEIAGPSLASILMTGVVDGRKGLGDLRSRIVRGRVNWRWYAISLLTTPVLITAILLALSLVSPAFLPGILRTSDKFTLVVLGFAFTFAAASFEEIGWTGFATPRLLSRYSALATSLIIGVPWVIWHFLPDFWGDASTYGALYAPHYLFWIIALPAYRILMTWVYSHTQSVWIAQLMHASFIGSQAILGPSASAILSSAAATPTERVLWYAIFAIALWVVVGIVMLVEGKQLTRPPLYRSVRDEPSRRTVPSI